MTKSNLFTQLKSIEENFCRPKKLITFAGLPGVSLAVQTLILLPGAGSSTYGSGLVTRILRLKMVRLRH